MRNEVDGAPATTRVRTKTLSLSCRRLTAREVCKDDGLRRDLSRVTRKEQGEILLTVGEEQIEGRLREKWL